MMVTDGKFSDALEEVSTRCWPSVDDARARELKLRRSLGKAVCLAETGQTQPALDSVIKIIEGMTPAKNRSSLHRPIMPWGSAI